VIEYMKSNFQLQQDFLFFHTAICMCHNRRVDCLVKFLITSVPNREIPITHNIRFLHLSPTIETKVRL
jgi:hypothetical protein